ncbi:retrovirus-related pol polyprotein from transposon TNT 1-94 [Tanacetum coccineum]
MKIKESLNVTFDETPPLSKTSPLVDDDLDEEEAIKNLKNVNEALKDESWIIAIQEVLNQFIKNDIWELVPQSKNMTIIGTKWVYKNKLDENGVVSRNKAKLVAQGYNQQEGIDYDETYALVARSERYNLAYFIAKGMEFVTKQPRLILPYVASTQASSSNPSKKLKLTIIPPRQTFVNLTSKEDDTTTHSPITKSSSPSPPNAPSKTPSTKDTSSTFGITSSFELKPQSSPLPSNDTPSPQPFNPFLDDIMDALPRPSNLLPLKSHPSLDITFPLSLITPLDHILSTPSPPSPQPPP